jgi:AraC-like DNA-binding protein
VSPNQFRRIVQFNRAFRQLNEKRFSHLAGIAYDNGYADQSHFNRSFREFTHQTVTQYLESCPAT